MIDEKRHNRIKAALQLKGSSLSAVARDLNVAPTTVSIVSRGFRRSRRIKPKLLRSLIAKLRNFGRSDIGCRQRRLR